MKQVSMKLALGLLSALMISSCATSEKIQNVVFNESEVPVLVAAPKTQTVVFKESEVPTIVATKKNKKVSFKIIDAKPRLAEVSDAAQ